MKIYSVLFAVSTPYVPGVPPKRSVLPVTRFSDAKVSSEDEFAPLLDVALSALWPTPRFTAANVSALLNVAARDVKLTEPPFRLIAEALLMRSVNAASVAPAMNWRVPSPFWPSIFSTPDCPMVIGPVSEASVPAERTSKVPPCGAMMRLPVRVLAFSTKRKPSPVFVSVPVPVSEFGPVMAYELPFCWRAGTSIVPPPAPIVMVRAPPFTWLPSSPKSGAPVLSLRFTACSVPPFKVTPFATFPRLVLFSMRSTPPVMLTVPVNVFAAAGVKTPPETVSAFVPPSTLLTVSSFSPVSVAPCPAMPPKL